MEWCICGSKELYAGTELEGAGRAGGGERRVPDNEVDVGGAVCSSKERGHRAFPWEVGNLNELQVSRRIEGSMSIEQEGIEGYRMLNARC